MGMPEYDMKSSAQARSYLIQPLVQAFKVVPESAWRAEV
jgi:hypothetical protein